MKRSRELYKRSRKTVVAIVLIHIAVPVFVNAVAGLLLVAIAKALYPADALHANSMITILQQLVQLPITILFSSLASVFTALLYWKLRLAGGETIKQAMVQFDHDAPDASGHKRPRTRARTPMRNPRTSSPARGSGR